MWLGVMSYHILGNFCVTKLSQKDNFVNDPCVQYKGCGVAILSRNLILRLSKICEICKNLVTRKISSIL